MDEKSPDLPNSDNALVGTIKQLQEEVKQLRGEIEQLKIQIKPDLLAKALDSSYLSINNLRAFLQILSLILTVFLAGAVYFGSVGLANIFSIREETDKVKNIRESVSHAVESISTTEQEVKSRMGVLQRSFNQMLNENESKITKVNDRLRDISKIFNKVAIQVENDLSAREMNLLFLLAREIDHEDPAFNFNAATTAFRFSRYEDALQILEKVLETRSLPPEILERAEIMRSESQKFITYPQVIRDMDTEILTPMYLGELDMRRLQANIFGFLRRYGYISEAEARKIIDTSRIKPQK